MFSKKSFLLRAIYRIDFKTSSDEIESALFRVDYITKGDITGHMIDMEGCSHPDTDIRYADIVGIGRVTDSAHLVATRAMMKAGEEKPK